MTHRAALVAFGLAWLQATSLPSGRTAAISGTVTDGANHQPLSGVIVTLSGTAAPWSHAVTDSKGRFVFRYLPVGSYGLSTTRPGYVPDSNAATLLGSLGTRIALGDGEWVSDAHLIMWRLGGISGVVLDEAGEPLVGVPVRTLSRVPIAGGVHWAGGPVALTDDRGAYRIAGLRKGNYVVSVPTVQSAVPIESIEELKQHPAKPPLPGINIANTRLVVGRYVTSPVADASQAYPAVFYPSSRSLVDAMLITIADAEERHGVDFVLRPVPAVTVAGRLVGPAGAVDKVLIRLLPRGSETLGVGGEQATTIATPDGSFVLLGVPAGDYTLNVGRTIDELTSRGGTASANLPMAPGMVDQWTTRPVPSTAETGPVRLETREARPGESYVATMPVTVGSADLLGLVVDLKRTVTLSGRIVRDDGARVSPDLIIYAHPAPGSPALGVHASAPLDAEGRFVIDGLKPGDYFLHIYPGLVKSMTAADGDHTDRPFTAVEGTDITGVVATITDQVATLTGEVRDRDGGPIPRGAVILFPTNPELWKNFGLTPYRIRAATFLDRKGYRLTQVPAGEYCVIAVATALENAWQEPGFLSRAARLATRVTVKWGETQQLNLMLREVPAK